MSTRVRTQGGRHDAGEWAAGLTLRWVRAYTAWVGTDAAERRRAEIDSDVWEQRADARERGVTPATAALSIAGRVVAGIPADLMWVQTQRLAMRGQRADGKVSAMNTLGQVVARWWWVVGAVLLAVLGIIALLLGGTDLARVQVTTVVVALVAGVVLRHSLPRVAGTLIVFGAAIPALLFWAPWLMVIGIPTLVGGAIEVIRLTSGATRRTLAGIGLAAVAGGWVWISGLGGAGSSLTDPLLWAPLLVMIAGIVMLIVTGTKPRVAVAH